MDGYLRDLNNFDLLNSSLDGTNLIEASAGTGKTYTITGLFLRLLLEKNLSVNEILVVTFTEAATGELKERIRGTLREAVDVLSGERSGDPFLNDLLKKDGRPVGDTIDPETALRSLRGAVRGFDEAAIFTIHGFCRRMLHENAFESGSLFDTELIVDQEDLKKEIVDDFWRKHLYNASALFVNYALHRKSSPDSFMSLLAGRLSQPYLKIIPQLVTPDSSLEEAEFREYFNKLSKNWEGAKAEVEKILTIHKGLNRNKYRKANIPGWVAGMGKYLTSGSNNPTLFRGFEKFTSVEIGKAVKKGHTPPFHPFFDFCEKLKEKQGALESVFEERLLALKAGLFGYGRDELARRKKEKNVQSFDDLLLNLHRALEEGGGEGLVMVMKRKFKAALIDEFQDTDPVQYAIIKKVFSTGGGPLFLIGDPKQAIYSFRGADIFAYMDAAEDAEARYTLGENWRSERGLIAATNTIFTRADRPFLYDEISFQPAVPATKKKSEPFRIEGEARAPFQLWFLNACKTNGTKKAITKTLARELISKGVAAEIARLVNLGRMDKALLEESPLTERDIAVLVRTNNEARLMQEALSALKIPSVLHSTGNLFESHEAVEMERVLMGIAETKNERFLKAALATDIIGVSGGELEALMRSETAWEERLVRFGDYHDLWNKSGFIRMFRYLMSEEAVLPRLMSLPDGERRNTNLLHLAEVLHRTSMERKLHMTGLLKWFSEQRNPNTGRLEEHQLRLESDENAVKLITIHKSKGLEYPVVFYPFAWAGSRLNKATEPFTFHNEADKMELTLDLGSAEMDRNRLFAEKELLAENLRLLYVALTRAKSRCYLVWGRFNRAETAAPAYLFHQSGSLEREDPVNAIGERFKGLSDEDVLADLKVMEERSGGTIELSEMPTAAGEAYVPLPDKKETLACRKFSGKIDRHWRISSFSSLVSSQPHGAELADRDVIGKPDGYDLEGSEKPVIEEAASGIFSFPRGTKAGIFLHDVFEHLNFKEEKSRAIKELITGKLKEHGFESIWEDAIYHMIQKVLSVPLDPDIEGFTLSHIPDQDRINEMEFYFPLRPISSKILKTIFAAHARSQWCTGFPERIERLQFSPIRGFMKGFVDMVFRFGIRFYLVDWKSNFLGSRVEDYNQDALAAAMEDAFYVLQYYIYTVALNQYLKLRIPEYNYETHFGGVYYIFLRGVEPDRGAEFGIFRDRPPEELIQELCTTLIGNIR